MAINPGEIVESNGDSDESQADKVTRLAKEALNSEDVQATRAFLEEVNKVPDKKALAQEIEADQSGLIDGPIHYFSGNPTASWYDSDGWEELTFKSNGNEIQWNSLAEDLSEMSDERIARFEKNPGAEASNIVELARKALNSGSVADTRNFLQGVNNARYDRYDLATMIEADQSGPIDGIAHAFSDNPTITWDWDSHPMGRWASEISFKIGDKEISWHSYLRNVSEMSDTEVARYNIDHAEEWKIAVENARLVKERDRDAVEEVGEMSELAETVLENPNSAEAKQALMASLRKTEPLKTSMAIDKFESSWSGRSEPDIEMDWTGHPMGDRINYIRFTGNGREITWKPGDKDIEVKDSVDI